MLVTNKEVLSVASDEDCEVGAFNINNMPIMVSISPSAVKYAGLDNLVAMVKTAAKTNPSESSEKLFRRKNH
jgi:fructose/tagatose bisphosphate aldolase